MKISKVYLFINIIYKKKEIVTESDWNFLLNLRINGETYESNFKGEFSGMKQKPILNPQIKNEYWKSNVEKTILYENETINNNTYLTLCYLLKPNVLNELFFNHDKRDIIKFQKFKLMELAIETFPDLNKMAEIYYLQNKNRDNTERNNLMSEYQLLFKKQAEKYSTYIGDDFNTLDSFLVLCPDDKELENLQNNKETISNFLTRFENSMHRVLSVQVSVPYYYHDFIETMDNYYSINYAFLRVLICTKANGDTDKITIPKSIKSILEFETKLDVLNRIQENLKNIYANRDDIKNYIDSISKQNIFKNYTSIYKDERLKYFQTKFEIEEIINDYESKLDNSFPYFLKNYYDKVLIKDVSKSQELYSWSFLQRNIINFDELRNSIKLTLKVIETKDNFISTYLNNIISIESSWTNLKLQKTIKKLTYIAVIIAFVSIIITLFSNEIRLLIEETITFINN